MKSYEQLSEISNGELTKENAEKGFKKWCEAVGYDEERGNKEMFNYPPVMAIEMLKIHSK